MKGKIELRYTTPNISRLRTRLSETPQDLTSSLREIISKSAAKVIEANQCQFKARVIELLNQRYPELKYSSKAHKDAINSVLNDFFSIYVEATKEEFEARFGKDVTSESSDVTSESSDATLEFED